MERRGVEAGRSGEEKMEEEDIFITGKMIRTILVTYLNTIYLFISIVLVAIARWSRASSNLVTNDLVTFLFIDLFIVDSK